MDVKKTVVAFLLLINIAALSYFLWQKIFPKDDIVVVEEAPEVIVVEKEREQVSPAQENIGGVGEGVNEPIEQEIEFIPEGVNESFRDLPKTQLAWMKRGNKIIAKNYPGADSAEIRGSFFHRGHLNNPVVCGEAKFLFNDVSIEDFQRYIFVGIEISYYENRVNNFERLWEIMCVQTFDEQSALSLEGPYVG